MNFIYNISSDEDCSRFTGVVLNTDRATQSGTHWVLFVGEYLPMSPTRERPVRRGVVFDPLNNSGEYLAHVRSVLPDWRVDFKGTQQQKDGWTCTTVCTGCSHWANQTASP